MPAGLAYIGFTLVPGRNFEERMEKLRVRIAESGLPPLANAWQAWHNGAYIGADRAVIKDIEVVLDEIMDEEPQLGLHVYVGYPKEFYEAPDIDPVKYS